jgi:dTDP-glucose 4,6-dehydratase
MEKGHNVRAFIRYNSNNHWGWLESSPVKNDIDVVLGDIRDYDSVYSAIKSIDVIFHLAALVGIPFSYVSPLAYIRTNIIGTYNILEGAKHRNIEQIIVTSTSETYGTAQYVPIDEKHPVIGQSPYAASKIAADQIALSYFSAYRLPIKIVRPFNTYGPRQSARAIIPSILIQILSKRKKISLGNLNPTRDFTFVADTVAAYTEILKSDNLYGEIVNVGMNEEISIANLVKIIMEIMHVNVDISLDRNRVRPKGSEVERLRCDNTKLLKYTSWRPKSNLKKGLLATINWMGKNIAYYKPKTYNI